MEELRAVSVRGARCAEWENRARNSRDDEWCGLKANGWQRK